MTSMGGGKAQNKDMNLKYIKVSNGITITQGCRVTGELTIPDQIDGLPVTAIGSLAFYNCTRLKSVIIPSGVLSIGNSAFAHCSRLKSVIIPSSVLSIGISAFAHCIRLTSITIPNSITSIHNVFYGCTGLTSITTPNSDRPIGKYMFPLHQVQRTDS